MTSKHPAAGGLGPPGTGWEENNAVHRSQPPAEPMPPPPASLGTIGRYTLLAELGRGGMGTVYRAADQSTGQVVALKVLELCTDTTVSLFEREYQTLSFIDHPCVPKVYDFGVAENSCRYYTMTLIEGRDMHTLAPMPWPEVCRHLRDVAMALACLHARGLLHRDISPRNIRIDQEGCAKLIDFGALAPFGLAEQLVGTPACGAPEALRRIPLDQRADLFSLGATGYMALTRRRPFQIQRWTDAEAGWQRPPNPLTERVSDIPRELDELILSLLQLDKQARPGSAADVIERLERIADIEEPHTLASYAPLASGGLIGRDAEQGRLLAGLESAMGGHGGVWVMDGVARCGRTRMCQEIIIAARLVDAIAVSVTGFGPLERGGTARALIRALASAAPTELGAVVGANEVLVETFPELRPLGRGASLSSPPSQVRDGFAAVPSLLSRLSLGRPLLLVVDDAQAVDQVSAGVLFAVGLLARSRPIMVVLSVPTAAPLPGAIAQLLPHSERLSLAPLPLPAVGELVESVFGKVDHRLRLTQWLYQVASGNAGHSLDLMRDLVDRGIIRRLSGSWTLPQDILAQELPSTLAEALRGRLLGLSRGALSLGRLLSLYGVSASEALCDRFQAAMSKPGVRRALSELTLRQVVAVSGDSYCVPLEELRVALLEPLTAHETRELHGTLGNALLDYLDGLQQSPDRVDSLLIQGMRLRAGFHLLSADDDRAQQLLPGAAIELTRRGEGLVELIPTLESAIDMLNARGEQGAQFSLMAPLIIAGTYMDYRLTFRYGDRVVSTLAQVSGIASAERLQRYLPRPLALICALGMAALRWRWVRNRVQGQEFREMMLALLGLTSAVLGTYAVLVEHPRSERVLKLVAGLGLFPPKHPVALVHGLHRALYDVAKGEYGKAEQRTLEVLSSLPQSGALITGESRQQFVLGLYVILGSIACYRADPQVLRWLSELDRLPLPQAREAAAGIRANYYANRGEVQRSVYFRGAVDALAAQGGAPWQQDLLIPRCLWWIEVQSEDGLALKRTLRKLEEMLGESASLAMVHAAAHACYMADRGLQREALLRYGSLLEEATQQCTVYGLRLVGAYARVLRLSGQAERAHSLCVNALGQLSGADRELTCLVHGVELERIQALLSLDHLAAATAAVDELLREQAQHDNPLLHALTHRLEAQIALHSGDRTKFANALSATARWCRETENPALFRQLQRLVFAGRSAGMELSSEGGETLAEESGLVEIQSLRAAMSRCADVAGCSGQALRWVMEFSGAADGALFLVDEDHQLRWAAPAAGAALSAEVWAALRAYRDLWTPAEGSLSTTIVAGSGPAPSLARRSPDYPPPLPDGYNISPLLTSEGLGGELVGLLLLRAGASELLPLPAAASQAIADVLRRL